VHKIRNSGVTQEMWDAGVTTNRAIFCFTVGLDFGPMVTTGTKGVVFMGVLRKCVQKVFMCFLKVFGRCSGGFRQCSEGVQGFLDGVRKVFRGF
jgi:hypothetical protein